MKIAKWLMILLVACTLPFAGCGKQAPPPKPVADGVTVDLPKLKEAFATATDDLQVAVSEVAMGVRYGDYPRAFAGLDKLTKAPGLTDQQKKIVEEVTAQIKEAASKAQTAPPR